MLDHKPAFTGIDVAVHDLESALGRIKTYDVRLVLDRILLMFR
jgi:hypothetical protein